MATLRLLIVEDDPADVELIVRELTKSGFDPTCRSVATREAFVGQLVEDRPDVVIYDHNLPHFSSAEALQLTKDSGSEVPFIIVSHAIGDEDAVALMRAGAADYLLKDRLGRLGESVRHALEQRRLREEHAAARQAIVTLNEDLALRIAARTAELRVANHALEVELDQRKQAEEALRQLNSELEERVEARTRDIVASHNRLQALASELTLAEQRERKRLAAELHDYLAQMLALGRMKVAQLRPQLSTNVAAAQQITGEIDDLFKRAGEYTRSLMAKLSPPVLDELGLPAALTWLAKEMPLHGLKVDVRLAEENVSLPDDQAVLLFQSVRELLINVAKHAGTDRATVTLRVESDGQLYIEVEDNGCGFDATAANTKVSGSAFGLFSVRERMQAMGGRLDVMSAPSHGTTITLSLPLQKRDEDEQETRDKQGESEGLRLSCLNEGKLNGREEPDRQDRSSEPEPAAPVSQVSPGATRVSVLLVDDHLMVRQGLKALLDSFPDVSVIGEAGDGQEAIVLAGQLQPDLVLMDINMPWMDGIEATKRIKEQWPETPVIGLSVDNQPATMQAMKAAGAALFVSKDAAAEHLHDVIVAVGSTTRPASSVEQERLF
jgi:signal transduction histidine kinase